MTSRAPSRLAPVAERRAFGKSRRTAVPRAAHATLELAPDRADPLALLAASHRGRVKEVLPIKWRRMAASPFGFFRGAAAVMAADLGPRRSTGLLVQLCGDAHVRNLGAYAAPDGHLVFDVNDFDETQPGPWEWDLKRLSASAVLAGREAGDSDSRCRDAVEALVRSYRESLELFARMPVLALFRHQVRRGLDEGPVHDVLRQAQRDTAAVALKKLTVCEGGKLPRFAERAPDLRAVPAAAARRVLSSLAPYRETVSHDRQLVLDAYRFTEVAFKVVGTGSVGLRDYVVLGFGSGGDDPMVLQVKEACASSWAPWAPKAPVPPHHGRRVAEAQHRMQTVSDPLLGWTTVDRRPFLVRQFSDHKASIDPGALKGAALAEYALVCGELFAKAHARTGDPAILAGYCGGSDRLDRAFAEFAVAYADRTAADHERLVRAIRAGKIEAAEV